MAELTLSAVANVTFVDSSDCCCCCCCCFGILVEDVIVIGEAVKTVEGVTSSSLLLLRVLKIAKDILCRHDVLELHGEKANIEDFLHIYTNEMHRTNQFLILWLSWNNIVPLNASLERWIRPPTSA